MKLIKKECHNEASLFKASCDARIKKCRHPELVSGSPTLTTKLAAMFGLDARIALAIFGALSVISGAALFSAIQAVQTERYWQDFQEIIKASEAYYLDNGKQLPQHTLNELFISDLKKNRENIKTWVGPYISGDGPNTTYFRNSTTRSFGDDSLMYMKLYKKSTWVFNNDDCEIDSINCTEWVALSVRDDADVEKAKKLFYQLDEKIDNGDGIKAGKVRKYDSGPTSVLLYIQGMQHKRIS